MHRAQAYANLAVFEAIEIQRVISCADDVQINTLALGEGNCCRGLARGGGGCPCVVELTLKKGRMGGWIAGHPTRFDRYTATGVRLTFLGAKDEDMFRHVACAV